MQKNIWRFVAWVFIADGVITYIIAWIALLSRRVFFNIPNEFLFYDAIASGIFGIFFLMHYQNISKNEMHTNGM